MTRYPTLTRILSIVLLVMAWQLSVSFLQPDLLPSPWRVMSTLGEQISSGELPYHLSVTLQRVVISFSIAMLAGSIIGIVMGHSKRLDLWFDSLLTLALNIPALVIIILCFIWFGLNEETAILAVILNKTPNIATTMREGAKAINTELMAVAQAYKISPIKTLRCVYLPQLYPYFLASARSGLALVWKIVLVVELLGCSEGVGFQLSLFFQFFDIASILAYTLAFAAIIYTIEGALLRPWERRVSRWR